MKKFVRHFLIFIFWHLKLFIVVQVKLSPYSPHHSHPPQPSLPPTCDPTPLWLCPWVLYACSLMTLPPSPTGLSPPTSPLVTVSLFFISMSVVIFCLRVCFVDLVPLIGEIIWYLSFTAWLISLSIMPLFFFFLLNQLYSDQIMLLSCVRLLKYR